MANGTIAFDTLQTSGQITGTAKSVDTDYLANGVNKVWVNFDGTGTIAVKDSFNVSGITDDGTGNYTITIANDMVNAFYCSNLTSQAGATAYGFSTGNNTQTASALTGIFTIQHGGSTQDVSHLSASINGDLA